MQFVPKGIIPAMVTPIDKTGRINESALRKLTNHLIDGGVHGLFPVGSQGEFFSLTFEQKKETIRIVVDETRGRVPVYAGTGTVTTREAIETTKMAQDLGVDAVSVITPYFLHPQPEGADRALYGDREGLPEPADPALLQPRPDPGALPDRDGPGTGRRSTTSSGSRTPAATCRMTGEYIRLTRGMNFHVLMGRDTLIYAALCYGAAGSICATGNVDPRVPVEIYEAFIAGDHKRALDAQYRLAPLRIAFGLGTFPVVVKEALTMIGIEAGPAVRPIGPMTPENREKLRKVLADMGMLKK